MTRYPDGGRGDVAQVLRVHCQKPEHRRGTNRNRHRPSVVKTAKSNQEAEHDDLAPDVGKGAHRVRSVLAEELLDRGDEFGGAFDDFGGFLRARRGGLVVAFLTRVLGAAGEGAEALVELAGGNEDLAEQGPGTGVGLRELASLGEGGSGRVEHSVIGGAD